MLSHGVFGSTPFRLAMASVALFTAAFAAAGLLAFKSIERDLAAKLDGDIRDTYAVMSATYAPNDVEDLVGSVEAHVLASKDEGRIYLLTAPDGSRLAGNMAPLHVPPGWSTLLSNDVDGDGDGAYRVFAGAFDGYQLVVGKSEAEAFEIKDITLHSFAWAALAAFLLVAAGGAFLASRVQRRLQAIAATMRRVSDGELAARIPVTGSGDDVDRVSAQVNAALDRLATLFESMSQISVDIAHDLKTPLNRLKLVIDEALRKLDAGEGVAGELADAKAESDQINATFDALLRIAQLEAGSRRSRFQRVDLTEIAATAAEIHADAASDAGKALTVGGGASPLIVLGDRDLLLQLFSNLIENAVRHASEGEAVGLMLARKGDKIVAAVADNGPGIPPEERDKVLRRFYRLEKSRTSPGTGLGLTLAKAIADLHGASLALHDNHPGLRVEVIFPAG